MPYRLRRKEPLQKGVRRVAREQIDRAIDEVLDDGLDRHETVHQVRKRCKKLRGLVRLVRPVFDGYGRENALFRDAARELSFVRDAQSSVECFDELLDHYDSQLEPDAFASVGKALVARREELAQDPAAIDQKLDEFHSLMREARARVSDWKVNDGGFSAVKGGLAKTYRRARKAMHAACDEPTAENFHEWRKRVKYHWHHTRLLRSVWPAMMSAQRDAAHDLSDLLGDAHDLAVLRAMVRDDPDKFGPTDDLQALVGLIDQRRAELRARSVPPGERLLTEKPKNLAARLGGCWRAWKRERSQAPELQTHLAPSES